MADIAIEFDDEEIRKPEFAVTEMSSAHWCMRKIWEARLRMAERADLAQKELARIQAWLDKENAADLESVAYLESKLEPWVEAAIDGGKKRSINLPFGIAGFRHTPDKLEIKDEAAALAWAKANKPEAVKVRESILKEPLADHIKTTGEIPDGCEPVPGEDRFYTKTEE
ncbi:MAG: host-nuclease inhibitor Gam family protein [Dehalococcoidia bacterium]|jgi:phage host-nuclease inhibitor protein Gam